MLKHPDPPGGVTLTEAEHEITDLFLEIVIEGKLTLFQAARAALSAMPYHDPDFVSWLLQGNVEEAEAQGIH